MRANPRAVNPHRCTVAAHHSLAIYPLAGREIHSTASATAHLFGTCRGRRNGLTGQPGMRVETLFDGFAGSQLFRDEIDGDACPGGDGFGPDDVWSRYAALGTQPPGKVRILARTGPFYLAQQIRQQAPGLAAQQSRPGSDPGWSGRHQPGWETRARSRTREMRARHRACSRL